MAEISGILPDMYRMALICLAVLLSAMSAAAEPMRREVPEIAAALNSARQPLDSCGGRGWADTLVPDGPFRAACQTHDACYRSTALDQGTCDRDFLADMRAACDVSYPTTDQPLKHAACSLTAWTYFRAVNSRFGALNYPAGDTDGQILNHLQTRIEERDGRDELKVCVTVANTANRVLHYLIVLHDEDGDHAASAPAFRKIKLQPDDTKSLCVDTDNAPFASWDSIGDYYSVTLKVDDPDQLSLLGDLIGVDRLDCEKRYGTCRHAAP